MLNPASGRDRDGRLYLLPRLVAAGNVSRVGLAEVVVDGGAPGRGRARRRRPRARRGLGARARPRRRRGPAHHLDPGARRACHDLRGLRAARAADRRWPSSDDLRDWRRLGPVHFEYQAGPGHRPEPVPEQGRRVLPRAGHRARRAAGVRDAAPADVGPRRWIRRGQGDATCRPAGRRPRPGIWISYVPVDDGRRRSGRAAHHAASTGWCAMPEYAFEALKIGAGPPPMRIDEGWLLIHHGVTGELDPRAATSSRTCTTPPAR